MPFGVSVARNLRLSMGQRLFLRRKKKNPRGGKKSRYIDIFFPPDAVAPEKGYCCVVHFFMTFTCPLLFQKPDGGTFPAGTGPPRVKTSVGWSVSYLNDFFLLFFLFIMHIFIPRRSPSALSMKARVRWRSSDVALCSVACAQQ